VKRSPIQRLTPLRRDDGSARATVPVPKAKKCRACKEPFLALRPMQVACGGQCAAILAIAARQKAEAKRQAAERKADRVKREAMKPRSQWLKEAQAAFNKFIRLRDAGQTCIDCGEPFEPQKPGGSVDAGHYLSRGSAPHLKFNENNCFAQRKNCNRPGGTTRDAFRAGVLARIGLEALEALESDQSVKKYTADDFRAIRDTYRAKARALEKT
jgi:hypothetical protein